MLRAMLSSFIPANLKGFFPIAEIGEGYIGECIYSHSHAEQPYVQAVVRKQYKFGHRAEEECEQDDKSREVVPTDVREVA